MSEGDKGTVCETYRESEEGLDGELERPRLLFVGVVGEGGGRDGGHGGEEEKEGRAVDRRLLSRDALRRAKIGRNSTYLMVAGAVNFARSSFGIAFSVHPSFPPESPGPSPLDCSLAGMLNGGYAPVATPRIVLIPPFS